MSENSRFVIHPDKSVSEPNKIIDYLGFTLNEFTGNDCKTNRRQSHKVKNSHSNFLRKDVITLRQLAQIMRKLEASFPGVQYGRLFYRR